MKEQYGKWKRVEPRNTNYILPVYQHIDKPELLGCLRLQGTSNGKPESRFLIRINTLKQLDHPNILKLLDYDLEAEHPWMITELCKGGDLRKVDFSKWTVHEKFQCYQQVCDAFAYLWEQGITKSDHNLKNIFLKENKIPVIGDFESASSVSKDAEGVRRVLNQASLFLWEFMEGKDFNLLLCEERRINKDIDALSKEIENLQSQKEKLYSK